MADKKNDAFNLESAMDELAKITEQISAGKIGLEESLRLYEKGMVMVGQCRAYLDAAEKRIKVIAEGQNELKVEHLSVAEMKGSKGPAGGSPA